MDSADGLFLGLISGTSMDGIDAALVRRRGTAVELVAARTTAWPPALREDLSALARGAASGDTLAAFGRLDRAVGERFAAAAIALLDATDVPATDVRAIGSHGQTVLHRPDLGFSLQIGDPARIARISGITTIADFRRADLAAGGEGAPLAPILHHALFSHSREARAVVNLGGIANVTLLVPGQPVTAFDVGPANTLLDALAREAGAGSCDRDGRLAAAGQVDTALLAALLADPWFARPAPKSTGPEYFNLEWVRRTGSGHAGGPADLAATLTELAAAGIAQVLAPAAPARVFCCGGGVHNGELMRRLAARLPAAEVTTTAALGADPDYVEAMCFAWLAGQNLAGRAGNLPEVTGAEHPAVLGAIHHVQPRR